MTDCASCGTANPSDARFCLRCGSPLGKTCERCGGGLPGPVRFCPSCGATVAEPGELEEERKVVSVLFVDLVGFTGRSDRADPEDVRATLRPYHARVKHEIERFGGTVEKFVGDAVMAAFRPAEAAPSLEEASGVFRSLGARPLLAEAESLLGRATALSA